jgi:phage-related protein
VSNIGYATLQVIPSFKGSEAALQQGIAAQGGGVAAAAGGLGAKFGDAFVAAAAPLAAAGTAVAAGKFLYDLGSQFDEQFDKIRVSTGATGKALEGLTGSFKNVVSEVPTDFNSAGDAIASVSAKLDLTGQPLKRISKQFLEVSRITGTDLKSNLGVGTDAIKNFGLEGKAQSGALDILFRASQKSGVGFTELAAAVAANGVTLRAVGLDFTQSTALVAALGKAGVDVSQVMPGLSKAIGVAAQEGKSASTFLSELFTNIKNAPDDTTAASLAFEVLGAKAGPKFAALIREGKLAYDELLAGISKGDTIMKASKDTQDFGEKWLTLKNQVFVVLEPIATKLFDIIGKGMTWISEHREDIGKVFQDLGNGIQQAWKVAGPFFKNFFLQVKNFFALFDDIINGRWGEVFGDLGRIITQPFKALKDIATGWLDIFNLEDLPAKIGGAIDEAVGFIAALPGKAVDALGDLAGFLVEKGAALLRGLLNGATSVLGEITTFFTGLPGQIVGWIGELGSLLLDKGVALLRGFINGFMSLVGEVTSFFTGLAGQVVGWVGDLAGTLVSAGVALLRGFINGFMSLVGEVTSFFTDLPGKVLSAIGHVGDLLWDKGVAIMKSLLRGLRSGFDAVKDFVGSVAGFISSLKGPLEYDKRLLIPHGQAIMAGLLAGSERGMKPVAQFYGNVGPYIADIMRTAAPVVTQAKLSGGSGWEYRSGPVVGTMNVYGNDNPEVTADAVNRRIARAVARR